MSDNILNSSAPSEELNKSVADKIAKHLFIICNYNPDSIMVYSNDAKFIKGIMNMYKFLIDVGLCNRISMIKKKYSLSFDICKLEQIISTINSIRTCLGHNEDYRNGSREDKETVEHWFSCLIGKKYPESAEEYEKPLQEIAKYGDESVNILDSFIEEVAKHKKKEEIIKDWEKLIFDFYKRPNSKNIFKGNLKMTYQAYKGTTQKFGDFDIAMWTKNMYFYNEQSMIDNLNKLVKRRNLPTDSLKKINEKIKENEDIISERITQIATFAKKSESDLKMFDYLDYYLARFPQRIIDEFENGNLNSLLPQDVVQKIIDNDFSSIPVC